MKLNMGCGRNHKDGYVNVDSAPGSQPDEIWDLEQTPWPWADNSAEAVLFNHSLEHMGGDPKVFLAIMKELYRIAAPNCEVLINVPHPRHNDFINDPTHVRAITPEMLALFDRKQNDRWVAEGAANTPLAHYLGVDFEVVAQRAILAEPYASRLKAGEISSEELMMSMQRYLNVVQEFRITLRVRKDGHVRD